MSDIPAGAERLSPDHVRFRPPRSGRAASDLLCNGAVQNKAVRFGSLEPGHVTLAKRAIRPFVVVFMLAVCELACGQHPSSQSYALGLAAFLIAAHAQHLWQFQLSVGLCVGLGIAMIGNVPNSILLGRWFGPRLPTAMAILYSATGAGILVLLPASQLLIDRIGWRDAYQLFGVVALCLLLPLLVLPWRLFATGSPHIAGKTDAGFIDNGWTLGSAMRHHVFWALFSTFFFTAVAMYAITAQIVAYLIDAGFPPLQAATAWGFSGIVLLFGMLGISTLDGLIGRRPSVLFSYGVSIVGIILLWLLQYYPNYWLLTGFVVCFGSMIGSRGPLITATALNIFRGERVGTIFGTISIGSGLGSALGSWSGGLIHDWTHSYNWLIVFALVNVVLGLIPFLVVPALRR